jgi:hypothetical protein
VLKESCKVLTQELPKTIDEVEGECVEGEEGDCINIDADDDKDTESIHTISTTTTKIVENETNDENTIVKRRRPIVAPY